MPKELQDGKPTTRRYSVEEKAAAVRMVRTLRAELATLGWVHWHNTQRLHGYLGDPPPTEFENAFYAVPNDRNLLVEIK